MVSNKTNPVARPGSCDFRSRILSCLFDLIFFFILLTSSIVTQYSEVFNYILILGIYNDRQDSQVLQTFSMIPSGRGIYKKQVHEYSLDDDFIKWMTRYCYCVNITWLILTSQNVHSVTDINITSSRKNLMNCSNFDD